MPTEIDETVHVKDGGRYYVLPGYRLNAGLVMEGSARVDIDGDVYGNSSGVGVTVNHGDNWRLVAFTFQAMIRARTGFDIHGNSGLFENKGYINAETAIQIDGSGNRIVNSNIIIGNIVAHAGTIIENISGGSIAGKVITYDDLSNSGYISNVDFRAGGAKLTSRGEIYNLKVSGDDNTIDLRNGRGYSVALHGEDNDIVINSSIKFTGDGEHSGNTIQSFIDYHLDSAAQHLQLMGSAAEGNGNAWDNRLIGNDSDNVLNGRQGDDRLTGRDGNDRLTGGKGDDDFIFSKGNGKDVITDFVAKSEPEIEHDKLVFRGYDLTSAERSDFLDDHARDEGGNVVITMGHQQIKLLDLHVSDLSNADIAWLT